MRASDVIKACVELTTVNGRPFSMLQDTGFRMILDPILDALPTNEKICINTENVQKEIKLQAEAIRESIKEELKNASS